MIKIKENKYNLIEKYKNCFKEIHFKEKYTEYFETYNYIIEDWL